MAKAIACFRCKKCNRLVWKHKKYFHKLFCWKKHQYDNIYGRIN